MSRALNILRAGPSMTVQDRGRPGLLDRGLSAGGAADTLALAEGAALLGQAGDLAALEMAGLGGEFAVTQPVRFALTGAPMRATLDGDPLVWNTSHWLLPGQRLCIGAAHTGVYGYLHLGGGIDVPVKMGARSAHLTAGIGARLAGGDSLPIGVDAGTTTGMLLPVEDRFSGGVLRIVPSIQTDTFSKADPQRCTEITLTRDPRGNRMGVRLTFEGAPFRARDQLSILSEIIVPGDVQITGDGAPFILLVECQTTGGYPRLATVIPPDLPKVAQSAPGAHLQFQFIDAVQAKDALRTDAAARAGLSGTLSQLVRDPRDMRDLLSYQFISGVTDGASEGT